MEMNEFFKLQMERIGHGSIVVGAGHGEFGVSVQNMGADGFWYIQQRVVNDYDFAGAISEAVDAALAEGQPRSVILIRDEGEQ